jgi:LysR family transcriptional regulator for bpeEF and oprC
MEIFTRVVDTNSFTKAADSLQLARPVISRAIQELEARLGVRLINRTTRRLNLTEEGRSYYESAVKILQAVDESESAFNLGTALIRGTLKVDVQTSIARHLIVPRIPEFRDGGFKSEAQQGANEWKLRLSKRLRAYVRRPRMVNEMHG